MKLDISWNLNEEFSVFENYSINELVNNKICTYDSNTNSLTSVEKDEIPLAIIESSNLKHNLMNNKILKAIFHNIQMPDGNNKQILINH